MRKFILVFIVLLGALPAAHGVNAEEQLIPRTIIALYDDHGGDGDIENTYTHLMAEMPLNQLGLNVEYHDIHEPLPDIANRKDVRGVLTWFFSDTHIDANTYLDWALNVVNHGKKYVVMGALGIAERDQNITTSMQANRFFSRIGIKIVDRWVDNPFGVHYKYNSPEMFMKQTAYTWKAPPYQVVQAIDPQTEVHLFVQQPNHEDGDSALVVTNPNGGYVSGGYIFRANDHEGDEVAQWLINPFEFFRRAYGTDDLPKPDTTTIAGRRLFYSNIDGDGWNNVTQLEEYRGTNALSARVILDKVAKGYPDLPIMLALIAAEIDPDWAGVADSRQVAREFLALPNIEAGTHTYSHPFNWQFFRDGKPDDEIPYLPLYPTKTWGTKAQIAAHMKDKPPAMPIGYTIPRAYAREPFDIHKEIEGSVQKISELLPEGKKIEVLAWPGNCSPWEEVIHMTREMKLQNINGGDTRFDPDYPGYASVAPIGKQVGKERQIYVSTSNENTYTNLWSENFFAHKYLKTTLQNTETPMRLKPLTIYFHIYAGEREASLNALLENFNYARQQDIAPITTGHFTHIAEGFYGTQLTALGPDKWRVDGRGMLETIRFDHQLFKSVDFERSVGVVGQRPFQGSLYVYLDANVAQPVIALKDNERFFAPATEATPYLLESRWLVSNLMRKKGKVDFTAQGYGAGEMTWQMPAGAYRVSVDGKPQAETFTTNDEGLIQIESYGKRDEPASCDD